MVHFIRFYLNPLDRRDKYMSISGISHVFFLLETLTRIHIATENLLNASCFEIPLISHVLRKPNILATVYPRKQEVVRKIG